MLRMLAGVVVVVREPAVDAHQPPDPARGDQLAGRDPARVQPVHERLHEPDAFGLADGDHVGRLIGVHRERLLAQHVLPRTGRGLRPLGMEVVRERDVDGVDVGVGEEFLVRAIGPRDVELRRNGRRAAWLARRDRVHRAPSGATDSRDDLLSADVRRRQDSPADRGHCHPRNRLDTGSTPCNSLAQPFGREGHKFLCRFSRTTSAIAARRFAART